MGEVHAARRPFPEGDARVHIRRAVGLSAASMQLLWLFVRVEIGLRFDDLPSLCRRLGIRLDGSPDADGSAPRPLSRRAAMDAVTLVRHVSRRWPWGDTCLRRSLVLGAALASARPTLVLGVRKSRDGDFAAHAWLEVDGVSSDPTSTQFSRLAL